MQHKLLCTAIAIFWMSALAFSHENSRHCQGLSKANCQGTSSEGTAPPASQVVIPAPGVIPATITIPTTGEVSTAETDEFFAAHLTLTL